MGFLDLGVQNAQAMHARKTQRAVEQGNEQQAAALHALVLAQQETNRLLVALIQRLDATVVRNRNL